MTDIEKIIADKQKAVDYYSKQVTSWNNVFKNKTPSKNQLLELEITKAFLVKAEEELKAYKNKYKV